MSIPCAPVEMLSLGGVVWATVPGGAGADAGPPPLLWETDDLSEDEIHEIIITAYNEAKTKVWGVSLEDIESGDWYHVRELFLKNPFNNEEPKSSTHQAVQDVYGGGSASKPSGDEEIGEQLVIKAPAPAPQPGMHPAAEALAAPGSAEALAAPTPTATGVDDEDDCYSSLVFDDDACALGAESGAELDDEGADRADNAASPPAQDAPASPPTAKKARKKKIDSGDTSEANICLACECPATDKAGFCNHEHNGHKEAYDALSYQFSKRGGSTAEQIAEWNRTKGDKDLLRQAVLTHVYNNRIRKKTNQLT